MIVKYERGEAVPSIDAAKKIADALKVSLDNLVGEISFKTLESANVFAIFRSVIDTTIKNGNYV